MDDMEEEPEKKCGLYVGQRFTAWKDAEVALDNNCESRLFQCPLRLHNENVKLQSRQETELYSEDLEYKNIVLTCASAGPKRINRGKGERPIQATWKIDCPVKVQLIATKNYLQIEKRKKLMHENTASTAKTFTAGVKPCVVRSTLRSLGCDRIQARDLSNLRAKWKREKMGGKTPEQKLAETIQQLLQADSQACVHTGKGEDGDLEFLFVQTSAMRAVVEKFGTVMLLDHTYKINKAGMPVTVFMCMDGNGNGRAAGYAFIANEKSVTIQKVLQCFVSVIGDKVASAIQTVVIDKDYSEVKGIRNVLPNVHIQLCDFHVKRTFDARVKKFKETEKVSSLLTQLRFCGDEKEFDQLTAQLESESSELFFQYFKESWMLCSLAWSFRDKKKSANLGNNTNNRLENHKSKIKVMLGPNLELFEALEKLIELVLNKEDDVFFPM
ncbi:hypothetical protein KUF71_000131 [Frankliniella fusca]|uniref:ZSWIM1/3 RNaseH-like domain-containing protein n=1 Tax=Frankliniella fusca TaxID=407009 RepID=A0AAE1LLB5_9NEOP|nr:hypothetical protein KUF71_000131 [Frankliniella fusca]